MDDDWSKKFTHIPCSRQITNGQWMFNAVHLYSAFEQNYNGAVTCPKHSAHIHLTMTFKKFNSSSTEVKTPNEAGRLGRVWVSLCLHLAPCLRKSSFCWVYFWLYSPTQKVQTVSLVCWLFAAGGVVIMPNESPHLP